MAARKVTRSESGDEHLHEMVPLDNLILDIELQPRETIDLELVGEYAEALEAGAVFPPVTAFRNGKAELLLSDGWHRRYAHAKAGRETIAVEVRKGDRTDAIRHSLRANATHGKRRTERTLRRAYELAVKHGLVDPADVAGVQKLLQSSQSVAYELVKEARRAREDIAQSLAVSLAASGSSQQEIADRLRTAGMADVDRATISRWLVQFSESGKTHIAPGLPSMAALEQIEEQMYQSLRRNLEPDLREQLQEQIRGDFEVKLQMVKDEMAEERAQVAKAQEAHHEAVDKLRQSDQELAAAKIEAAEARSAALQAEVDQLRANLDEAQQPSPENIAAQKEREQLIADLDAKTAALSEAQSEAASAAAEAANAADLANKTIEEQIAATRKRLLGPAADKWFDTLKAIDAVLATDQNLADYPHELYESKVKPKVGRAIARLRAIKTVLTSRGKAHGKV